MVTLGLIFPIAEAMPSEWLPDVLRIMTMLQPALFKACLFLGNAI